MKNNATNSPVLTLVYGAAIAAIYVVLTMVFLPISFGPIQFRISELLCVLPYFTPAAIPGLFIGCLLANFLGGAAALDVIFGSIATLIGAVGSYLLRKNRYLVSVPPILANMIIVPWVLRFAYGSEDMIWFSTITVGIGEILAIGLLGQILLSVLIRYAGNSIIMEKHAKGLEPYATFITKDVEDDGIAWAFEQLHII